MSGTLEGQDDFAHLFGTSVNWKLTRSNAMRMQPDRRETVYGHNYYPDANGDLVPYWAMGPVGTREYGELHDNGWGGTITGTVPYRLGRLGAGKMIAGFDRQTKKRENFYRRFNIVSQQDVDNTAPPESVLSNRDFVRNTLRSTTITRSSV